MFAGRGLHRLYRRRRLLGKPHVKILSDGWTAVTRDRSLSAQFEHSVGVTADGVDIFTLSQCNAEKPPAAV